MELTVMYLNEVFEAGLESWVALTLRQGPLPVASCSTFPEALSGRHLP